MRTLKKSLALVLAVVLVLGVCAVSASAEFTDAADINYEEAVTVLSGIGVLNGFEDGSFQPQGKLTRAQATKIIAYLMDAGDLSAKSTFDDTQGHWAESTIAFCASEGIVAGVGDNKFNPDGELTGSAFAKMILCAIGYDAETEGMLGGSWEVGVAKLVKKTGIAANIKDFDGSKPVTREQACELAFRAAQLPMQEFVSGTKIEGTGLSVSTGGTYKQIPEADQKSLFDTYFKDLEKQAAAGVDAYGRPNSVAWTLNDEALYSEAKTAKYTLTATNKEAGKTGNELAAALKAALKLKTDLVVTGETVYNVNGVVGDTIKVGDTVEVFVNKDDATKIDYVIVTHYTLAKITKITALTEKQIATAKEADETFSATKKVKFTLAGGAEKEIYDSAFAGFAYEKDAFVLAAMKGDVVLDSKAAETVTGKVTAVKGTTYNIGGTYYAVSDTKIGDVAALGNGSEGTWVIDASGDIAAEVEAKTAKSTTYAYVYNIAETTPEGTVNEDGGAVAADRTFKVYVIEQDGSKKSYDVAVDSKTVAGSLYVKGDADAADSKLGKLTAWAAGAAKVVPYALDKDGKFLVAEGEYGVDDGSTTLKGKAKIGDNYANANTTYVFVYPDTKGIVTTTVKTGYTNANMDDGQHVVTVYNADTKDVVTVFVTGVFAEAATDPVVAILASEDVVETGTVAGGDQKFTYTAYVDGKETELAGEANNMMSGKGIVKGNVFTYTLKGDMLDAVTKVEAVGAVQYISGTQLTIAGKEVSGKDAKVYSFNEDGDLVEDELELDDNVVYVLNGKEDALLFALITPVA